MGVSVAEIRRAQWVREEAPDLAEKVAQGEITLDAAYDIVNHSANTGEVRPAEEVEIVVPDGLTPYEKWQWANQGKRKKPPPPPRTRRDLFSCFQQLFLDVLERENFTDEDRKQIPSLLLEVWNLAVEIDDESRLEEKR
jgi:hypothetical protein